VHQRHPSVPREKPRRQKNALAKQFARSKATPPAPHQERTPRFRRVAGDRGRFLPCSIALSSGAKDPFSLGTQPIFQHSLADDQPASIGGTAGSVQTCVHARCLSHHLLWHIHAQV